MLLFLDLQKQSALYLETTFILNIFFFTSSIYITVCMVIYYLLRINTRAPLKTSYQISKMFNSLK